MHNLVYSILYIASQGRGDRIRDVDVQRLCYILVSELKLINTSDALLDKRVYLNGVCFEDTCMRLRNGLGLATHDEGKR